MCGIFGHSTNTPRRINQSNVRILGMFNESRGKTSCGITFDGEIYHGVEEGEKLFTNFIKGRSLSAKMFPLMFGHTRQNSVGVVNRHNAHPFGFGENSSGGYRFIGVHNGTLLNYKEIAKKYDISLTDTYRDDKGTVITRDKIDSEIILESIYKTKSYKALSEYNGGAALVWTDTEDPGTVYLWSGRSKPEEDDDVSKAIEERPLIVYVESKNSFYFSSMAEALYAIGGKPTNVFQIDYNTVYKVKDGNFKEAEKLRVSRKENYQKESYGTGFNWRKNQQVRQNTASASGKEYPTDDEFDETFFGYPYQGELLRMNGPSKMSRQVPAACDIPFLDSKPTKKKEEKELTNIYYDKLLGDQNSYKDKIYVKKFRYCRNGHGQSGIFIDVPGWGLLWMGDNSRAAEAMYYQCVGKAFCNGYFNLKNREDFNVEDSMIPFTDPDAVPKFYYLVDGIMLRTHQDYVAISHHAEWVDDHVKMSHASMYPVVAKTRKSTDPTKQDIRFDGELFTGEVTGLYFERTYVIKDGNLIGALPLAGTINNIKEEEKEEGKVIQLPACTTGGTKFPFNERLFTYAKNLILDFEKDVTEDEMLDQQSREEAMQREGGKIVYTEAEVINEYMEEKEKIGEIISKHFVMPIVAFQKCREELEPHKNHPDGKAGIKLIDDITLLLNVYIEEEEPKR